jgi:hypothetical protein
MKQWLLALALAGGLAGAASAPVVAAGERASCTGLSAASDAQAGAFPEAVFTIKEEAPTVFGLSFGALVSSFSQLHEGSPAACQDAFGGGT